MMQPFTPEDIKFLRKIMSSTRDVGEDALELDSPRPASRLSRFVPTLVSTPMVRDELEWALGVVEEGYSAASEMLEDLRRDQAELEEHVRFRIDDLETELGTRRAVSQILEHFGPETRVAEHDIERLGALDGIGDFWRANYKGPASGRREFRGLNIGKETGRRLFALGAGQEWSALTYWEDGSIDKVQQALDLALELLMRSLVRQETLALVLRARRLGKHPADLFPLRFSLPSPATVDSRVCRMSTYVRTRLLEFQDAVDPIAELCESPHGFAGQKGNLTTALGAEAKCSAATVVRLLSAENIWRAGPKGKVSAGLYETVKALHEYTP